MLPGRATRNDATGSMDQRLKTEDGPSPRPISRSPVITRPTLPSSDGQSSNQPSGSSCTFRACQLSVAGAAVTMTAVAIMAGYFPARRAARLDPLKVLRHE